MNTRKASIVLEYDNVDITLDVEPFIKNVRYTDRTLPDKMDELNVTFQDVAALWRNEWFPERGAKIKAIFKVSDWFTQGDSFERDCGGFEIDEITSKGPDTEFSIGAVSVGILSSIRRQQNTKAWGDSKGPSIDIKTIADELATNHGFELKWFSNYNPTIERWEQKSESDLSALKKICEYAGLMIKITDKYIVVFRGEQFDAEKPEKKIRIIDDGVKTWSFNANSADIYSACEVKYYDPVKKELLEYLYKPDSISGVRGGGSNSKSKGPKQVRTVETKNNTRMEVWVTTPGETGEKPAEITEPEIGQILKVNRRCVSLDEAEQIAKAALRSKNMRQVKGSLTMMGRPDLYSGININIMGFGRWDSVIWNIEEITHDYSKSSGYSSTLSLRGILGY